jgi:enoyl-[acyl-carrier protein] reductase I
MLLEGKRILVTGVLTDDSIAYAIALRCQEQGAEIVLTGAGRGLSLTRRTARKLVPQPAVLELDVTSTEHLTALAPSLRDLGWDRVDGVVHAIGFAPPACLGSGMFTAGWEDVSVALHVSTYSLKALAEATLPLMGPGSSLLALDFDASVAWPAYDWMGVAKAALESTSRYLARDLGSLGIRVNLVAAGPIRTMAGRSIPGFATFEAVWAERAPLGWAVDDADPVARSCVALLSDWFPATTGEIIHVDGGFHAVGTGPPAPDPSETR